MSIIKSIKNMFSNDIKPDENSLNGLVVPYALKHSKVKLDSRVFVPKDYVFSLGHNGKTLDIFNEGEYFLSVATLPECCKRLKIHKTDKNNNIKKSFKADAYFVNIKEYKLSFKTQEKAELGRMASGIFKVGLNCDILFKVVDVKKFMDTLLYEYAYLKPNEAEKILNMLTSDFVVAILNKFNFALSEFINSNEIIEENLTRELSHKYLKMGLMIQSLTNIRYILPKKYQKEYENNLNKKYIEYTDKHEENIEDTLDKEESLEDNLTKEDDIIEETESNDYEKHDDEYVPFGNIIIEETQQGTKTTNINELNNNENNNEEMNSDTKQTEQITKDTEFIDLNLDNLYSNKETGKECQLCGYINSEDAKYCEVCKNKLD